MDIQIETGPGGGKRAKQRHLLADYAQNLKNLLPSTGYTLARVVQIIKGMRGAEDTMNVWGLSRAGRYTSFLELFPKLFDIVGSGPNIRVLPKAPEPPRPVQPRPVQVGSAPSSGAERAPRTIEVDPRIPYRNIPDAQRVRFGANPARPGSDRYNRFDVYRTAATIGET